MHQITRDENKLLSKFARAAFDRVGDGKMTKHEGVEVILKAMGDLLAGDLAASTIFLQDSLKTWGED
jgi:hypothetical protein